jgi:hypothetical protein
MPRSDDEIAMPGGRAIREDDEAIFGMPAAVSITRSISAAVSIGPLVRVWDKGWDLKAYSVKWLVYKRLISLVSPLGLEPRTT